MLLFTKGISNNYNVLKIRMKKVTQRPVVFLKNWIS